ncbi:hypothetical protein ATANTOWER_019595, partial [Ataeniobius toweri]|nr:hypothetical protein [Ataeniobius toweri]
FWKIKTVTRGGRQMNCQGGKKGAVSGSGEYCPQMMDWSRDDNRLREWFRDSDWLVSAYLFPKTKNKSVKLLSVSGCNFGFLVLFVICRP